MQVIPRISATSFSRISRPGPRQPIVHRPGFSRAICFPRALPKEDNNTQEDGPIIAAAALAADNTIQAFSMLLLAGGVSSWQGLEWNWLWPDDTATATAILCSVLPIAFTIAVCLPSYDMGAVVGAGSSGWRLCSLESPLNHSFMELLSFLPRLLKSSLANISLTFSSD